MSNVRLTDTFKFLQPPFLPTGRQVIKGGEGDYRSLQYFLWISLTCAIVLAMFWD